jgi:hypothetical protein
MKSKMDDRVQRHDFILAWAGATVMVLLASLLIEALR